VLHKGSKKMKLAKLAKILFGLALLAMCLLDLESCGAGGGGAGQTVATSGSNATNPQANPSASVSSGSSQLSIDIPVSVVSDSSSSLALTGVNAISADSFVINLANCASGLSGNNSNAGTLNVYLGDTSCLGKLTSLVVSGQSYLPTGTGSSPFTTWLAGNSAIFVGSGPSDLLYIKAVNQLSSPIVNTDSVKYTFTSIVASSTTTITPSPYSATISTAGVQAADFQITSGNASLTGMSSGAGVFQFNLSCKSGAMTQGGGVDTSFNSFCPVTAGALFSNGAPGVDIGSTYFSYKLITDPNGDGTLTLAQAQSAFSSGDSTVNLSTQILSGSTGFSTGTLTGPITITSNPKMILILQTKDPSNPTNPANSSFQYFPITVQGFNP